MTIALKDFRMAVLGIDMVSTVPAWANRIEHRSTKQIIILMKPDFEFTIYLYKFDIKMISYQNITIWKR